MRTIRVGRSKECDIILTYDKISRVHAEITLNGGQYVYHDVSKNGSNIGGRIVIGEKIIVAPGTTILLANKVPLPWERVYPILNPQGADVNDSRTVAGGNYEQLIRNYQNNSSDEGVGCFLAGVIILFPVVGIILYFTLKNSEPKKAKQAGQIALIMFIIQFVLGFIIGLVGGI